MITAFINTRGFLEIRADADSRDDLKAIYADERNGGYPKAEGEICEALHDQWELVPPEALAALTSAPIFVASEYVLHYCGTDAATPTIDDGATAYWFPNYQIIDPWQHLAEHGAVEFDRAVEG